MKRNGTVHGFSVWQPFWAKYFATHSKWLEARLREVDEIFFVRIAGATGDASAFNLEADRVAAENDFADLCRRFQIVGVGAGDAVAERSTARLIQYQGLEAPESNPDSSWLERGREIGWTDEYIREARAAFEKAHDVQLHVTTQPGGSYAFRSFLAQRNALRETWTLIRPGERPSLPLRPIVRIAQQPLGTLLQQPSAAAVAFADDFERFCQKWELNGFETWDLPLPRGPFWPDIRSARSDRACTATLKLETPWHFVAWDSDGLGELAMEQLRRAGTPRDRRSACLADIRAAISPGLLGTNPAPTIRRSGAS